MALNKVEICGVNTAKLPVLNAEEKEELFSRLESHCKVEDYIFVPAILKLERRIRENEK